MEFETIEEINAVYDFLCDYYTQTEQNGKIETLDAIMGINGNEDGLKDFLDYYWRDYDEVKEQSRRYLK